MSQDITSPEGISQYPDGSTLSAAIEAADVPEGARTILLAAASLFARRGFGPTSVRNIASAAEVTAPMVYYYFEGKEQIFVTLFDGLALHLSSRLSEVGEQLQASFRGQLIAVARVFRDLLHPCPVALQLVTQYVFGPRDASPRCDTARNRDDMRVFLQDLFESAISQGRFEPIAGYTARELAVFFINAVPSHMMWVMKKLEESGDQRAALYDKHLTDEALERLVDIFLNGAGKAVAPPVPSMT